MTGEEILKLRKGDVLANINTREFFIFDKLVGTPECGYVEWRNGESSPASSLLYPEWASMMRENTAHCTDLSDAVSDDVRNIMLALSKWGPDKKITITKDWWKIEYLDKDE